MDNNKKKLPHFRHKKYKCPSCSYEFDCASPLLGDEAFVPKAGDFTLCLKCASILRYGQNDMILATTTEINTLLPNEEKVRLLWAQRKLQDLNSRSDYFKK